MKDELLTWLHRKLNNTSASDPNNGLSWYFCTGCNCKGNHVVSECRKTGAITQAKKNKKPAVANTARMEILPVESSADDHSVSSVDSY